MENNKDSPVVVLPSQISSANSNQVYGIKQQHGSNIQFMENGGKDIGSPVDLSYERTTTQSVSISMPPSPLDAKRVLFKDEAGNASPGDAKDIKFHYSQPIVTSCGIVETGGLKTPDRLMLPVKDPKRDELKDNRYNSFKTWSGRLESQLSTLRGKSLPRDNPEINPPRINLEGESLSVDRYFDALQGPELETLRPSEEIILPEDKKWPFLLRYPISSFGICLGVSSQAIMWKNLASTASTHFLHISLRVNYTLWCTSILLFAVVASTYLLKVVFYFEAVRREYYHPIRVNFFFAPWIALLFLAIGVPEDITTKLPHSLWYALMTPIFCLEIKIYGQWMSGGQRRLSKAVRVNFFRGFKFSLAWWAYTFPMTGAAIATIRYSSEVSNVVTKGLSLTLSTAATVTVTGLLITTIVHAFVLGDLFPNDIGIAISDQKPKTTQRKWFHRNTCGSAKDIQHQQLKSTNSGEKIVKLPMTSSPGATAKPFSVRVL
uniref:S-type anion channel SLAH3-like isoform X2 n=1 Tax=Erigeron canadensis TaxID=72917 RepID=UPI001CB902F3|nr:S-type anion channel SLAH3-like isoform X2 [Erigeron canadensis]